MHGRYANVESSYGNPSNLVTSVRPVAETKVVKFSNAGGTGST